jgi:uncharacterized protein YndB with AHSA1/START domain
MTKTIDIKVSRTIPASAEEVFDVWLDPKSPGGPWYGSERVILNPVVDGLFYHAVNYEGRTWAHYGRFVRIERTRFVEHTWVSEATQGLETMVTVAIEPRGEEAEVTIEHVGVPDDKLGRTHEEGWGWILGAFAERFAKGRAASA